MVQSISFIEAGYTRQKAYLVDQNRSKLETLRFPSSVAVIEHSTAGIILFDTGYSTRFYEVCKRMPERIYSLLTPIDVSEKDTAVHQLKERGIAANDVKHVVLSHLHADHTAGAADFGKAKYHYSQTEYESLKSKSRMGRLAHAFLPALLPPDFETRHVQGSGVLVPIPELCSPDGQDEWYGEDLFQDGSVFTVPLPGHTQSHQGLFVRTQSKNYLLIGDAAWLLDSVRTKSYPSFIAQSILYDRAAYRDTFDRLHRLLHRNENGCGHHSKFQMIPCHCHQTLKEAGLRV